MYLKKETLVTLPTLFMALLSIFWLGMVYEICRRSECHVGYNILYTIPTLGIGIIFTFLLAIKLQSKAFGAITSLMILSIVAVVFIYQANILVPYEEWIHRGMPAKSWF